VQVTRPLATAQVATSQVDPAQRAPERDPSGPIALPIAARLASGWVAATGLSLVLFLVAHLLGVALAPMDPVRFEAYAAALHASPWLPLAELALVAAALTHLALALAKVLANRRAKIGGEPLPPGSPGLVSRRGDPVAALAARSAPLSGALLLAFLAVHLAQLRWPRPAAGQELTALQAALASPAALALYLAAALALGLHLFHGAEAAHRSLGLLDPANGARIRRWGRVLAVALGAGFALVPLLLVLGHDS